MTSTSAHRQSARPGLATIVVLGCFAFAFVPVLVAGLGIAGAMEERGRAEIVERLAARGTVGSALIAKRLGSLWREVERVAAAVPLDDPAAMTALVDAVGGVDERYSWLGIADTSGRVLAASGGLLVGESVAQRPWFREGLAGPFAGDMHEAQLLAELLGSGRDEPLRFIDYAAPVRNAQGTVVAVVGAHVDWRWVLDNLDALADGSVEPVLLARDRTVLAGPDDLEGLVLDVGAAHAARRGGIHASIEPWPDGATWVSVTLPALTDPGLPSFGWSLVLRERADEAMAPHEALTTRFWLACALAALVSLLCIALGARWLATPLRRLATSVETMIADPLGRPVHAETRYEEAAHLSRAIARLQTAVGARRSDAPGRDREV